MVARLATPRRGVSIGDHAVALMRQHVERLVVLHPAVLADRDPEPLHQMRVTMRRLRTCMNQFAPALRLPNAVTDQRIRKSVKRLGMARDLDVLRQRLDASILPHLPAAELEMLRPVLKKLRRERRLAVEYLEAVLRGRQHLQMVASLQGWLRDPHFSPLGKQALLGWVDAWQSPPLHQLFLQPGWWAVDPVADAEVLHRLRREIKDVRYRLENLQVCSGSANRRWIQRLRRLQDVLGELNDLHVLAQAIDDQLSGDLATDLPELQALLQASRERCWQQWCAQGQPLLQPQLRLGLISELQRSTARRRLVSVCRAIPPQVIRVSGRRLTGR